ncbi:hypothetical protein, partial [Brucella melitensis]|uniref:hypothetical protein n=1 Tax=Brucella melitensis TaxID=29459 RepID=UPI001AEF2A9E
VVFLCVGGWVLCFLVGWGVFGVVWVFGVVVWFCLFGLLCFWWGVGGFWGVVVVLLVVGLGGVLLFLVFVFLFLLEGVSVLGSVLGVTHIPFSAVQRPSWKEPLR